MPGYEATPIGAGTRSALLVVDVMRAFTDPQCPLGMDADTVVAAIQRLLQAFRARDLPIYFTTVVYDNPDQARVFRQHVPGLNLLKAGDPLVEIDPRIAPLAHETVILKLYASAFFATDMYEHLLWQDVDTLYVAGLTTSGCVRASVVDALQHEMRVIVPREAVGDWDPHAHESNLHDLGRKYADVVTLEDALAQLPE